MYQYKFLSFQTEYLNANLETQISDGYYFLVAINIKQKNQIVLSYETFNDLIKETTDKPYYRIGYNYLIKKYKLELSFDNYFQLNDNKMEKYMASIQLQIFLK